MSNRDISPGLRECYEDGCVKNHCPKCGGHLWRIRSEDGDFFCDFCKKYYDEDEVE